VAAIHGVDALTHPALPVLPLPAVRGQVTTTIVVVQTLLGLLGFWVAGTQVNSIIKGSAKLRAIGAIWSIFLHGDIRAGRHRQ
jgi:hypothetical protein